MPGEWGELRDWSRESVRDWVEGVVSRHGDHRKSVDRLTANSSLWRAHFTEEEAVARASMAVFMIEGYATRWFPHHAEPQRHSAIELMTDVVLEMLHAN